MIGYNTQYLPLPMLWGQSAIILLEILLFQTMSGRWDSGLDVAVNNIDKCGFQENYRKYKQTIAT
jgi:hypothetical protein